VVLAVVGLHATTNWVFSRCEDEADQRGSRSPGFRRQAGPSDRAVGPDGLPAGCMIDEIDETVEIVEGGGIFRWRAGRTSRAGRLSAKSA
jgi:hypothetical protein